jgi:hypothetical protein
MRLDGNNQSIPGGNTEFIEYGSSLNQWALDFEVGSSWLRQE